MVAIDAKRIEGEIQVVKEGPYDIDKDSRWEIYTHGGRKPTGIDAVKWAEEVVRLGSGEILLTSMDCDGHQDGYDLELTRTI